LKEPHSGHPDILPRPVALSPETTDPLATEWLLTNGIGGFSMGTMLGVPTRRYHALLVAAMHPPVARVVALHSMDELVTIDRGSAAEQAFNLTRFHFAAGDRPATHPNLLSFERGPWCVWRYMADGVLIEKRLHLCHGRNAAEVRYTIRAPGRRVRLQLRPLIALRDFHSLRRRPRGAGGAQVFQSRRVGMGVVVVCDHLGLVLTSDAPRFRDDPAWWTDLHYQVEHDRGQDTTEDLYTPGEFILESQGLDHETSATIYATVDARPSETPEQDVSRRSARIHAMVHAASGQAAGAAIDDAARAAIEHLCAAADEFVVPRGGSATDPYGHPGLTILAGYPWFADWGRDAMIAAPGLLISTGRHEDARGVLHTFARHLKDGIIPNRFDDFGGAPHYNTADASLWFVHAAHELWRASGVDDPMLLGACVGILDAYRDGTNAGGEPGAAAAATGGPASEGTGAPPPDRSGLRKPTPGGGDLSDAPGGPIAMDPQDALVAAGDERTQLTWMDARRDGISFTPRAGKAVEINALWHHGLRAVAEMSRVAAPERAADLEALAERTAASFRRLFWNPAANCLFDVVPAPRRGPAGGAAAQIRPNQVFAVSLAFTPLTPAQRAGVLGVVGERLLTPVGLRTLDPADPNFRASYTGPLRLRDEAYHNGTVWPWLLGAYAEATMRHADFSPESCLTARRLLTPLIDQMSRHCPGHIAEVYDGDTPAQPGAEAAPRARPDGCPAQAWSIATALRAYSLSVAGPRAPR
jgi:predicted glycogen debranching enzyme